MNNAAWVLRRSPLFLLAGDGSHRFQPVHVRDIAALMEELGTSLKTSGEEVDACGPDAPTAIELFTKLRDASGGMARIAAAGPLLSTAAITADKTNRLAHGRHAAGRGRPDPLCAAHGGRRPGRPAHQGRRSLFAWIETQGATSAGASRVGERTTETKGRLPTAASPRRAAIFFCVVHHSPSRLRAGSGNRPRAAATY